MKFLSQQALYGLQSYKYKSGGYTYLDSLHNPFWNYLVECLPTFLAPNLITLLGALGIFLAYAANITFNASFTDEAPSWVYVLTAASIVLYINLDCVDGKQARRTKTSSPLGQLFDHGVDALVLHMMLANISASLGVACGWKMASAACLGIMVPWVLAQWEEYHSGIMMYGTKYYGVLEANYCICIVHIISAIWGLSFWRTLLPLPEPIVSIMREVLLAAAGLAGRLGGRGEELAGTYAQSIPSHVSVADAALLFVSTAGFAHGLHNVVRVLGGSSPQLPKEEEGHKQLGRRAAALQLLPLVGTTILGAFTVALPCSGSSDAGPWQELLRSSLGLDDSVIDAAYCRFSFSTYGLLYALMATQLIIAHMAKEPLVPCYLALGCFGAALLNSHMLHIASPSLVMLVLHTIALAGYLIYTTGVIGQICEHLGINCLTIKPTKDA
ncbi:CDP-Ethanolamine:DAG ethanolamine phosphotransferase [Dunaliella salina]|uniref:CDP-Ethanolamine:DAG ethanolamine phosphotransferase n=1 Tax=Dunaliella salina TaxID=3046 RepID=A0ABQ7H9D1_DUNSA|nr:CDP-Ethanolamine:DAG ethanolamine phosphotransferase [Dunaliella salina]|eukprot:KAF5843458.1 CDP-Ethanolamine:DAG ethanolamine phosphotransferase [Dunaliella salina]